MQIYTFNDGYKQYYTTLTEALYPDGKGPNVVSIIGAGGKTSTMYKLADEATDLYKDVIITTSTKILYPVKNSLKHDFKLILSDDFSYIETELKSDSISAKKHIKICGRKFNDIKLCSFEYNYISKLLAYCDLLLIEADGARGLPIKVPYPHEPVIISATDSVIICVGLDCIGKKLSEICYNYQKAISILGCDKILTALDLAKLITVDGGLMTGVPYKAKINIILNKSDLANETDIKTVYQSILKETKIHSIITSYIKF